MRSWFSKTLLTPRYPYEQTVEYYRASWLLTMLLTLVLLWGAWLIFGLQAQLDSGDSSGTLVIGLFMATLIGVPISYQRVQTGRLSQASYVFVALMISYISTVPVSGISDASVIVVLIPLIAASTLLDKRGMAVTAAIILAIIAVGAARQSRMDEIETRILSDTLTGDLPFVTGVVLLGLGFLYIAIGNIDIIARNAVRNERFLRSVGRFNTQVSATGELGSFDQEEAVLARALNIVHNDFGYIFAQIYLIDDRDNISRRVRTGLGEFQTAITEDVEDDRLPIIHEALQAREAIIVTPFDSEARRDYFLPSVHYGAIIPMLYRGRVVGVLDVQSVTEEGYSPDELGALNLLMNQTAVSMMQARIITELRRSLTDHEQTNVNLQTRVFDLERRGVTSGTSWTTYFDAHGETALGFDLSPEGMNVTLAHDLPEHLRPALERGEVVIEKHDDIQNINMPIALRDQTLGAMTFTIAGTQPVTDQQLELAQRVTERLAMALENARLFEQSRAQAQREQKANEISGLLISATDVDTVMRLAAETFTEALGAVYTRIHIEPDSFDDFEDGATGEQAEVDSRESEQA